MSRATQFGVGLDNKPGTLAKLCGTLRRAKVNIEAISVSGDLECCWVRLIAAPVAAAKAAMTKAGYHLTTQRVLTMRVPPQRGELERIAGQLGRAGVNIDYVYGSTAEGPGTLVLCVSDLDRAAKVLGV